MTRLTIWTLASLLLASVGCGRIYYSAWETLGYEKRDLLIDGVEDARDQQEETKEQFASALEQFRATFEFEAGEIEEVYDRLKDSYDSSVKEAERLRDDIDEVKELAEDLFDEWDDEIDDQSKPELRAIMKRQRAQTMDAYSEMITRMDAAADAMAPVLREFRDRVLVLKSSLNARAIASLEESAEELTSEIETLIREMNRSIAEADQFIAAMTAT